MDYEIRGRLESYVDYLLTEKGLRNAHIMMSQFRPTVSSVKDAIFGFILGNTFSFYVDCIDREYDRDINDDEVKTFYNIMELRAFSIKSKISEIDNL